MKQQIFYLRDVLEETTNDLNQVGCTLEMVLENIFCYDPADLAGSMEEKERARKLVESYPVWREVLALAWDNLTTIRDKMADACMTVESGRPRSVTLSSAL